VKIRGIPFWQSCDRQQEAYFYKGELTEEPRSLRDDQRLFGTLNRMRPSNRLQRCQAIIEQNPMPHKGGSFPIALLFVSGFPHLSFGHCDLVLRLRRVVGGCRWASKFRCSLVP
jgi:hypothetical protein